METTRIWKRTEIWENMQKYTLWLERGILAIFQRQTEDEKITGDAKERNGKGFNRFDAEIMTGIAEWLLSGNHLSKRQKEICLKIMKKYCGQLARIANGEI